MNTKIIMSAVFIVFTVLVHSCTSGTTIKQPEPAARVAGSTGAPDTRAGKTEWEQTVDRAQKEGKVVIYLDAANAPARDMLSRAIKERISLEPEILVARGAELSAKIIREQKAGLFNTDIFFGGGTTMYNLLKPAGVLGDLEPNFILPEVKDPGNWRNGKYPWVDRDKKILVFGVGTASTAEINTRLAKKEEMASYFDLLDSRWKGKIVMNDPTTPGKGNSWFMGAERQVGSDFLRQLVKQEPVVVRDQRQQAEWLAQGKYPVGVGLLEEVLLEFIRNGAPLDWILFKEGGYITGRANHLAVIANTSHPYAARVFINWFLGKEGQTLWSREIISVSQRKDVGIENIPAVNVPRPDIKYADQTSEEAMLERDKIMTMAKEIFGPLIR